MFASDRRKSGGAYAICVENLTKADRPYRSGDDHGTWDSITLP